MFIDSRSSLENHTRFQTKMDEVYTRFQTQTAQKPGRFGAAHTVYGIYKAVPPPPTPTPTQGSNNVIQWPAGVYKSLLSFST